MKRPTQVDVARLAGVSRATVSYVVNGLEENLVSEETREKVLKAVETLGYQPDAMAQSLRSGQTNTIGLLIPDMDNPHYWQIAKGVEEVAQQAGFDLLLISAALNVDRETHGVEVLSRRRVDGLILILTFGDKVTDEINKLVRQRKPVVFMSGPTVDVDYVFVHQGEGTRKVIEHLFSLGHHRIGFVYGVATPGLGQDRLAVFRAMTRQIGDDDAPVEHCGTTISDGYQAARKLLERQPHPTALLVINDLLAMGALRAAADLGLNVPGDVSIASFDDISLSVYTQPRLTTVGMDATHIGRTAAQMILNRLYNPRLPQQTAEILSHLFVRDSTGPAPHEE